MRRWLPWLALVGIVVAVLVVASGRSHGPRTEAARVRAIASQVRCPTCRSLSAEESDARAAQAVRDEIRRRVEAGESDAEIRAFLVSRYGRDILLKPEGRGVAGLVWVLPVIAVAWAALGLGLAFRRWSGRAARVPTDEDRRLVDDALGPA